MFALAYKLVFYFLVLLYNFLKPHIFLYFFTFSKYKYTLIHFQLKISTKKLNKLFLNKKTNVAGTIVEKLFHPSNLSTRFSLHHYFISTFHVLNIDITSSHFKIFLYIIISYLLFIF